MKSESYRLTSSNVLNTAIIRLKELPCDGKLKLTISDAGSKSSRQRGLQYIWYKDIVSSGIGGRHEENTESLHTACKYWFARPIFIRDDPFFADLDGMYVQLYGGNSDRMAWWASEQIHTEKLTTSQMGEYLTEIQKYYSGKGVQLTDPDDLKLLAYEGLS